MLAIYQCANKHSTISFDLDSYFVVVNDNANLHVCDKIQPFIGKLIPVRGHKIAMIGGHGHAPS